VVKCNGHEGGPIRYNEKLLWARVKARQGCTMGFCMRAATITISADYKGMAHNKL